MLPLFLPQKSIICAGYRGNSTDSEDRTKANDLIFLEMDL